MTKLVRKDLERLLIENISGDIALAEIDEDLAGSKTNVELIEGANHTNARARAASEMDRRPVAVALSLWSTDRLAPIS